MLLISIGIAIIVTYLSYKFGVFEIYEIHQIVSYKQKSDMIKEILKR